MCETFWALGNEKTKPHNQEARNTCALAYCNSRRLREMKSVKKSIVRPKVLYLYISQLDRERVVLHFNKHQLIISSLH